MNPPLSFSHQRLPWKVAILAWHQVHSNPHVVLQLLLPMFVGVSFMFCFITWAYKVLALRSETSQETRITLLWSNIGKHGTLKLEEGHAVVEHATRSTSCPKAMLNKQRSRTPTKKSSLDFGCFEQVEKDVHSDWYMEAAAWKTTGVRHVPLADTSLPWGSYPTRRSKDDGYPPKCLGHFFREKKNLVILRWMPEKHSNCNGNFEWFPRCWLNFQHEMWEKYLIWQIFFRVETAK